MKRKKYTIKYLGLIAGICVGIFIGQGSLAKAETEFMTSWQTKTYVPAWYIGKALPTYQSFITINFELIENGKPADLSKTIVRWYANGKLQKNETNGLGIKKFTLYNQEFGGNPADVKIVLLNYKGSTLEKLIDLPIKEAEVVIDVPYFEKKISRGVNTMYAWPFFFNALSANVLNLQWAVDGRNLKSTKATEADLEFTIGNDAPIGTKSEIKAFMSNPRKLMESVSSKIFVEVH